MLSLSESQARFRAAVMSPSAEVPDMLCAPVPVGKRFEIYRRHHRQSLTRHIAGRYPTVEWLLGSVRMLEVTERFVSASPPVSACMAEYGAGFAAALVADAATAALPYLGDVAALDWLLGEVSIAIDRPALAITALAALPSERLPDFGLELQPGLRFLRSAWPVDDLVRLRFGDGPPETLAFGPLAVELELRGARGRFQIGRLDPAVGRFRTSLAAGETLAAAMAQGVAAAPDFDPATALARLFAEGLVVAIVTGNEE